MAAPDRPYVRVYYEILEDDKFHTVYDSDACLAGWLRLLMAADAAWPQPCPLPRWLDDAVLGTLTGCGLVDLVNGSMYRIHGLDAERGRRTEWARAAGKASAAARASQRALNSG